MNIYLEKEDFWPAPPPITKKQARMMTKAPAFLERIFPRNEILLEVFTRSFLISPKNQDPLE
jgi:hypothetical protein